MHLTDFTDNYDFLSMRIGNQPFNADFRGFVFNDTNLGVRLFGNMDSNRWQFNLAAFDMREKDTYSELNTFDSRNQYVFVANVYRQDFLVKGLTEQLDFLTDLDDRPNSLRPHRQPRRAQSRSAAQSSRTTFAPTTSAGYGDGHIGRFNITPLALRGLRARHPQRPRRASGRHQRADGRARAFLRHRLRPAQGLILLRLG